MHRLFGIPEIMEGWSTSDDESLREAAPQVAAGSEGRWAQVADMVGRGKSGAQCKARWEELKKTKRKPRQHLSRKQDKMGRHESAEVADGGEGAPTFPALESSAEAVEIDGTCLEGGGQVVRQSVALSALLRQPIVIRGVLGKRPKPGLQRQHCTGVTLVAGLCGAATEGCMQNSATLHFAPRGLQVPAKQPIVADIQSAGAIMLLVQVVLPVATFAEDPLPLGPHPNFGS